MESRLVEPLRRLRYIQSWILGKEPIRPKHDTDLLHGHDGEVFDAGIVRQPKGYVLY